MVDLGRCRRLRTVRMGRRDKRKKKGRRPREVTGGPSPQRIAPPKVHMEPDGDFRWRLRRTGAMNVPGLIFGDQRIIDAVTRDQGAQQVANVATLPGIVGHAIAMPDIHWGYGFPIGGVAAFDETEGVVSPGGIGYDINCGVRLLATDLSAAEVVPHLSSLIEELYRTIPAGLGSKRKGQRLSTRQLELILAEGARTAVAMGFGEERELERVEDLGALDDADPDEISLKAKERGSGQLGTLGSGNHFVEVQRVDEIFDRDVAEVFGLFKGQLVLMIHTGSRGLGHQICTEAVKVMMRSSFEAGIALADRQLACAPLGSRHAHRYLAAMAGAANFAFANRQVLDHLARSALERALGLSPREHKCRLVYDVAHNIAKWEEHSVNGKKRRVLVHRKGATRALGPGASELPKNLADVGQPVLVPGDMGRASWVLVGTERAASESFSSSCHGAGRRLSRTEALRKGKGRSIADELLSQGIIARAEKLRTLVEEMPEAYKNVDHVVDVVRGAGLCHPVARMTPLGVIKG